MRCRYMGNKDVSTRFREESVAAISWDTGVTDALNRSLLDYASPATLADDIRDGYPEYPKKWPLWGTTLWQFSQEIYLGDLVVTNQSPITRAPVILGVVSEDYYFECGQPWGAYASRDIRFPEQAITISIATRAHTVGFMAHLILCRVPQTSRTRNQHIQSQDA